jgi:NADPH:quinone reductase-like Zn-dependent oxidoreductase
MRAVWITRAGGPEVLKVRETRDPVPRPDEVRIRVHAAGLNFAEVMARQGLYPDAPKPPCVVGYEVSGVIDAVGSAVTGAVGSAVTGAEGSAAIGAVGSGAVDAAGGSGLAVGQRVLALTRFGGHAETVCVPAAQVLEMPSGMDFPEAAAIPVNYATAYHMLFRVANLRPGQRVLVHMAAGGVGIAVLQLCRTVPDVVSFGTASAAKHEVLRAEGCRYPIDYHTEDYRARVRELTGNEGVDLVLDPLGGRDWKTGLSLLRPAGHLVAYGFSNMAKGQRRSITNMARQAAGVPLLTPLGLMDRNHTVSGVNLGHLWGQAALVREELAALLALWHQGAIKPRIDSVFPFAEAARAHERITGRHNVGKVVLVP